LVFSITQSSFDHQAQLWAYVGVFCYLALLCALCIPCGVLAEAAETGSEGRVIIRSKIWQTMTLESGRVIDRG
jgi:hypothetical protein